MDLLTEIIKKEIKKQYKSVRNFAVETGIPQTTLASALKKGVGGTAFDTVIKICGILDIKVPIQSLPVHVDTEGIMFLKKLGMLDEIGQHTVKTVLEAEYIRCK